MTTGKPGCFITLEGTEGGGKSTQIRLLAEALTREGKVVTTLREPGGTGLGEEIRHLLKHFVGESPMTAEAELLLMNASRAQLVREVIRPALARGEVVICDRFLDSTVAYQGYGRGLNLDMVRKVIEVAVGETWPDLTLLLWVPVEVSEARRRIRAGVEKGPVDRFEEADRSFFERVEKGFEALASRQGDRIKRVDATGEVAAVQAAIWRHVESLVR